MKKILFIFLLLLSYQIFPQTYKYAVLSDIKTGNEKSINNLKKTIDNIYSVKGISFLIIIGNATENGSAKELNSAKQFLDSLDLPYYIIPGNNDTKLSYYSLMNFNELWNDHNFFFRQNNDIHIGLNSGVNWNGNNGHFSPEDLNWLKEVLRDSLDHKSDSANIILYLSHPLDNNINNWFKVTNILRGYNIKAVFVSEGGSNKLKYFNGIPGVAVKPVTGKSKLTGYTLVTSNNDSLIISQVEIGRRKTEKNIGVISKEKNYTIPKIDSTQFEDYKNCVLWQKDFNTNLPGSIEISSNKIYAADKDGNISCFDLKGNKLWEYNTGETIISNPVVEGDILSAATIEGDLFAINANNGNVIQVIGIGEPLTSHPIIIDAVNQGSKTKAVVVGTSNGSIYCYDIYTLEQIWDNNSAKGIIETKPLYLKDRIIYGSNDGFLYCIDARSGILNWKWRDKNSDYSLADCSPVSNGKYVFISTSEKTVYAIDLLLGTTVWKTKEYSSWESLGMSNDNEKLFIKGLNNFYVVSSRTGKLIKEMNINYDEDTSPSEPVEWNDNILFGTENGNVYLVDQRYNWEKLFFMGNAKVNNIQHLNNNIFATSNIDGKVVVFTIK